MKLLLDENLSRRLVELLTDLYSGSKHVNDAGLARRADFEIWDYAKANGFAIISKDSDFAHLAFLRGHPPKVIQLRLGNCTTKLIAETLREMSVVIHTFNQDATESVLMLP